MARTGGKRPAWDDEPTIEALPDEPTVTAHVDVRAAFEAEGRTLPGTEQDRTLQAAVAVMVTSDHPPDRQDHTLPFGARATSVDGPGRARSNTLPLIATPSVVAEDPPYEVPGVGPPGAQRKRMVRIVAAVLSICGLLCVGALVRQLWPDAKSDETKTAASATATASMTANAAAAATSAPAVPPPAPPAVASEEPAAASAAPSPSAALAPSAAQAVAVPPPPAVPVAAANPPRRPAEPRGALVHPRTATPSAPPSAPPTATAPPRGNIVRDSPF